MANNKDDHSKVGEFTEKVTEDVEAASAVIADHVINADLKKLGPFQAPAEIVRGIAVMDILAATVALGVAKNVENHFHHAPLDTPSTKPTAVQSKAAERK
jgi:hypothetical protein